MVEVSLVANLVQCKEVILIGEKKLLPYQDEDVLRQKLLVENKTYAQVGRELGYSGSVVTTWANRFGIYRGEKWQRLAFTSSEEIISMYSDDKTLLEISDKFDCHYSTIRRILEENNIGIRTPSENKILRDTKYIYRKHKLNEDYFKIWSSEMAYMLGFIAADGCIFTGVEVVNGREKRSHTLKINLQEADYNHLVKFKDALDYGGEVKIYKAGGNVKHLNLNYSSLDINSMTMINDIKAIGIRERKSLDKEIPISLPEEYELDYIRGYFDGNGSVGKQYPTNSQGIRTVTCQIRVRIASGSRVNLEQMKDMLCKYGLKDKNISKQSKAICYEICYSTKESMLLFDLLYQDDKSMRLDRKYESFKECINQRKEDIKNTTGGIKIL